MVVCRTNGFVKVVSRVFAVELKFASDAGRWRGASRDVRLPASAQKCPALLCQPTTVRVVGL